MEMPEPTPRFTGIFIPVEILEREELSLFEKLLLSWIDALYCAKHGGCFASNQYIAKRLNVKENTVVKALINLRKHGLVETVSFDGHLRVMRSLVHRYVDQNHSSRKKVDKNPSSQGCDKNHRQGMIKITPPRDKNHSPTLYIESKVYKKRKCKEKKGALPQSANADSPGVSPLSADADSPPRALFSSKRKEKKATHVEVTKEEHKKLVDEFGEELTKLAYKKLSQWKMDVPKAKWKKSDYSSIKRWVIDAIHEEKQKRLKAKKSQTTDEEKENTKKIIEKNRKWAIDFLSTKKFNEESYLKAESSGVMIKRKNGYRLINYLEENFKEAIQRTYELLRNNEI